MARPSWGPSRAEPPMNVKMQHLHGSICEEIPAAPGPRITSGTPKHTPADMQMATAWAPLLPTPKPRLQCGQHLPLPGSGCTHLTRTLAESKPGLGTTHPPEASLALQMAALVSPHGPTPCSQMGERRPERGNLLEATQHISSRARLRICHLAPLTPCPTCSGCPQERASL